MADLRRLALGAGGAVVAAGAAALTGKAVVRRERRRADPAADEDWFELADLGVEHLQVDGRDGASLHLLAKGRGRPVLLVHGITLQAGAWRHQFALADRYRVLALDQRGHGRSTVGRDGFGLDRLADDLADVLAALGLRDAVLVGHSMGGMAIMRLAARHPDVLADRVGALVLVSTSGDPVLGFGTAGSLRRIAALVQAPAERVGWRRLPTYRPTDGDLHFGLIRLSFGHDVPPHLVEVTRRMMQAMTPEALNRSFLGLLANDELDGLAALDLPTIVIVGTRDLLTPVRAATRIAQAIDGAELRVVPGAGHQLMMERPAEVARAIDDAASRSAERTAGGAAPA